MANAEGVFLKHSKNALFRQVNVAVRKQAQLVLNPGTKNEDTFPFENEALVQPGVEASVLIGDIASYTTISQNVPASLVVSSVQQVMSVTAKVVDEHQGTTWKYEGDAVLAFWECDEDDPGWHCRQACSAALALDPVIQQLALDPNVWQVL